MKTKDYKIEYNNGIVQYKSLISNKNYKRLKELQSIVELLDKKDQDKLKKNN